MGKATLVGGQKLQGVHEPDQCFGEFCTIHHFSDHHMVTWPQNWRSDRRIMERICPHGVGHPDPDHRLYGADGVHGCDGCCREEDDPPAVEECISDLLYIAGVPDGD